MQLLVQQALEAVTIDSAKTTQSFECPSATHICFSVVASAASAPTGTTIQVQGSLDDINYHAIDGAVTVTGNGAFEVHLASANLAFKYYRLAYARTGGSYVATTKVLFKGQEL